VDERRLEWPVTSLGATTLGEDKLLIVVIVPPTAGTVRREGAIGRLTCVITMPSCAMTTRRTVTRHPCSPSSQLAR
jgi:hypothetical protein